MKIIIEINLDNAAMRTYETYDYADPGEADGYALGEVLTRIAAPFNEGASPIGGRETIRDANGNDVGSITVTED